MALYIAGTQVRQIYIGSEYISKVYVGSSLVFSAETKSIPNGLTTYAAIYAAMESVGFTSSIVLNGITHALRDTSAVNEIDNVHSSTGGQFNFSTRTVSTYYNYKEHCLYIASDFADNIYIFIDYRLNKQHQNYYIYKFTYNTSTNVYTKSATYNP